MKLHESIERINSENKIEPENPVVVEMPSGDVFYLRQTEDGDLSITCPHNFLGVFPQVSNQIIVRAVDK